METTVMAYTGVRGFLSALYRSMIYDIGILLG